MLHISDHLMEDDRFWQIIDQAGLVSPMTGGCLVFAKALMISADDGLLTRIVSNVNGGQTEHYGLMVDGTIYDANSSYRKPEEWISAFLEMESVSDRLLTFATGHDADSEIPDNAAAIKEMARLMDAYVHNEQRERDDDQPSPTA